MPYTTVGNRGGFPVSLASANYDTGPFLSVFPVPAQNGLPASWGQLPPSYRNILFQLIPGDMTTGSVTVYGTTDQATAAGNGAEWEPIVAPSSEATPAWSNPLSAQEGLRLLKTDAPFIAYRAVTSADFNGTTTILKVVAAS